MSGKEVIVKSGRGMVKGYSPDLIRSGGLGPCIAVGIYDYFSKSGYMMHEVDYSCIDFGSKIEMLKRDYGSLNNLKVFAAGNSIFSLDKLEQKDLELSSRYFVEEMLVKYFPVGNIEFNWLDDDVVGELFLDTKTGIFSLDDLIF